ncbi:hypothetical protein C9374_009025 [Naegleria lovaniensis]|uniref:RING-type domain-containing protein n=1 Tax=Naegleria lovaniensis TaxID=51637 RepID=A0AA88GHB9_NAELO|nr:uncharacterized protein C9374_009025 [Naegleria lovaniensis]KAG2377509.1 hypothetical protein C9374_009025 [Naegleria lovaniensis]
MIPSSDEYDELSLDESDIVEGMIDGVDDLDEEALDEDFMIQSSIEATGSNNRLDSTTHNTMQRITSASVTPTTHSSSSLINNHKQNSHDHVSNSLQIEDLEREIALMKVNEKDEMKINQNLMKILNEPILTDDTDLGRDLEQFLEDITRGSAFHDEITEVVPSLNEDESVHHSLPVATLEKDPTKSIMKSERMKKIGTEIKKPSVTSKVGRIILLRLSRKYAAFGTDRGIILIFNVFSDEQELRCILGSTTNEDSNTSTGKVTSMCFSFNEDWIVAGYEKGTVIVWDVSKASIIKRIDDGFTSPVVCVAFVTDMYSIVASEMHSSTFKCFALSKVLFRYSYSLMFQYSVGDDAIITMSTLSLGSSKCCLAVATRSGGLHLYYIDKILTPISDALPRGYAHLGARGHLPYIAWANTSKSKIIAYTYGKDMMVLGIDRNGSSMKEEIFSTQFEHDVCGLGWFDDKCLIVMTTDKVVHLFDIRIDDSAMIESENISFINLMGNCSNVSGSKHFMTDINQLGFVMLGEHDLLRISVKPWYERISQLSTAGLWKESLEIAHDFYSGKAKCVIGLNPESAHDTLTSKIVELVNEYLTLSLNGSNYEDYIYQHVGGACIESCVRVAKFDVLFNTIFNAFAKYEKTQLFLELVEPYIIGGTLKSVPWHVFECYVTTYGPQERERLDSIIMKLDLLSYDQYEILTQYCQEYNLLKSFVYITTIYKREYIEPLETLVDLHGESKEKQVAEVILHFLEQYLIGNIPEADSVIIDVKKDVVDFIFDEEDENNSSRDSTAVFHALAKHYPDKFFEVLEIAMNDDSNTNPWDEDFNQENLVEFILRLQKPNQFMKHSSYYDGRIAFFSFYSKLLAKGILKADDYNILLVIFTYLAEDSLKRLKNTADETEKQRIKTLRQYREERFIEILEKRQTYYDKTKFMDLAKRFDLFTLAKFFMTTTQKYQWYIEVIMKKIFDVNWSEIPEISDALVVDFSFSNVCHQYTFAVVQKAIEEEQNKERQKVYRFFFYCYITSLMLDPLTENGSLSMNEIGKRGISVDELTYTYLEMLCEFEDNKRVKEFLKQQGTGLDLERCMKICKDIPEAKSFLLERTGEVRHALNEILRELESTMNMLKLKLIDEVKRKGNSVFEQHFESISKDFNLITDDPPVFSPNEPIEDQKKLLAKKPKKRLPKVTKSQGYKENAELCDVLICEESKNLVKELKTAINLCSENSERKTLDDSEVRQLWFKLLNTFMLLQRQLRFGFLEGKPLKVSKEETDSSKKSDHFDEFDFSGEGTEMDEFDIIKEEIVDTNTEISKIEKDLNSERELQDPDEEKIERLQAKLKKKKDHVHNLQLQLKELEEKEKLERLLEEERNNDPRAPHNIQKLANLWLQRCNAMYIRLILSDMMRYVDIPSILNEIVNEHGNDVFCDVKVTIMRLLDCYSYESGLLKQSNELISCDLFNIGCHFHRNSNKALKPFNRTCFLCGNPLRKTTEELNMSRIFPCGHAFHVSCIGVKQITCVQCENIDEKELKTILKTSKTFKLEGMKAKEDEALGKYFDFRAIGQQVETILSRSLPLDIIDETPKKRVGGKNAADLLLEQLSATSSSSVKRLTGMKILTLAPPKGSAQRRSISQKSAHSKSTLMTVDENNEDESNTDNTTNNGNAAEGEVKSARKLGPIPKIKILDLEEIAKEIEEMYTY